MHLVQSIDLVPMKATCFSIYIQARREKESAVNLKIDKENKDLQSLGRFLQASRSHEASDFSLPLGKRRERK